MPLFSPFLRLQARVKPCSEHASAYHNKTQKCLEISTSVSAVVYVTMHCQIFYRSQVYFVLNKIVYSAHFLHTVSESQMNLSRELHIALIGVLLYFSLA